MACTIVSLQVGCEATSTCMVGRVCKVCAGRAQSNNSVGAQHNSVTVVDFHSDVVIFVC